MGPKDRDVPSPAENVIQGGIHLTSGFLKYPSQRDIYLKHPKMWIKGKKEDDGVYPYWRIHDKLYDLSNFMDKHPGGRFWIEVTQGTDITELFESSHFGSAPEQLSKKYFVEEISKPRNSPFTFEKEGFYRTLKRKVSPILNEVGRGPTWTMLFIQDSLFFAFVVSAIFASVQNCALYAVVAGLFLTLSTITSHNFFHQKDNWRMYIFDMSLLSSWDWRISHALSHHIFPNTIYDYEITAFEPHLDVFPKASKAALSLFSVTLSAYIVSLIAFYLDIARKVVLILKGEVKIRAADSFLFIQLLLMALVNGSVLQSIWLWLVLQTSANFFFLFIGFTAAHHHPEIYHEGDAALPEKDWGLHQIVATRERGRLFMDSLFLASVTFGNHTLHHLFPTVDHSKLPYLVPTFLETCQEFGIKFEMFTPWQHFKGFFQQLLLVKPNPDAPKCVIKSN